MTTWLTWARKLRQRVLPRTTTFPGSGAYWEQRYVEGGDSGAGSYGKFARFKADVLNAFFAEEGVRSAIEFGCGDGNQLAMLAIDDYLGVDVSPTAIARCRATYAGQPGRAFLLASDYAGEQREASLSLDVIYHLVEDEVYAAYMRQLFAAATRFVVVYSSNRDESLGDGAHVRHRRFGGWVEAEAPGWRLHRHVPNAYPFQGDWRTGSFADFFIYARRDH